MYNIIFKTIAIGAICFSIYSYLSPNSPKLYSEQQMATYYINNSITFTTANLMFKSHMDQCNYDYEQRSAEWKICVKSGLDQLRKDTLEQLKTHQN